MNVLGRPHGSENIHAGCDGCQAQVCLYRQKVNTVVKVETSYQNLCVW